MKSPHPKALLIVSLLSAILFVASLGLVFFYAPLEAVMNYVQKIFYFHIANAWVGLLGFLAASVAAIAYLRTRKIVWDLVEVSAVEISSVFFFIAIVSGSVWAKPTWGTWWTWEPRLTTAAILEMIYIAYLVLRESIQDGQKRAKFAAVYTLVGGVSVPVTFFSIRLWQGMHPAIIRIQDSGIGVSFGMTPAMLLTFFVCLFTFTLLFVTLLWHRLRIAKMELIIESMHQELMD